MYRARSIPYGDIYTIPTTAIDNVANKVYAEQKQKELIQRQDTANLDNEFTKELIGIKKADIPDVTKAWNDFKQAHISMQKKGQQATPDDQYAVLQKKADFFTLAGASKEDKERLKNYNAAIKTDTRKRYNLDAGARVTQMLNTPTSQRQLDRDEDELFYKKSFPDLTKVIAAAVGTGREVKVPTGVKSIKGDLYDDEEVYKAINTPNQIYDNLYGAIGSRNDHDNFTRVVADELTDEEEEALKTQYYAKINDPKYKSIYGEVKPFPESALNTDLGKAVALKTMQAVVATPLQPLKTESKLNQDKALKNRQGFAKDMQEDRQRFTEYMEGVKNANIVSRGANNPNNFVNTSGNALDEFGGVRTLQGDKTRIEGGIVYNKDGTAKTGETVVIKQLIPVNVSNALQSAKIPIPTTVKIFSRNGVIESIMTPNGEISRQAMENLQKKLNTEPVKAPQPVFGAEQKSATPPKPNTKKAKFD